MLKLYWVRVLLLGVSLFFVLFLIDSSYPKLLFMPAGLGSLTYLMGVFFLVHQVLLPKIENLVSKVSFGVLIKLVFSLIFVATLLIIYPENSSESIVQFFSLYLVFTAFDVYEMVTSLGRKRD